MTGPWNPGDGQQPYPEQGQPYGQQPGRPQPPPGYGSGAAGQPPAGQYPPGQVPPGQYPPTAQYPPTQPPPGGPPPGDGPPEEEPPPNNTTRNVLLAIFAVLVVVGAATAIILTRDPGEGTAGKPNRVATSVATTPTGGDAPSPFPSTTSSVLEPTTGPATSSVTTAPQTTDPITSEPAPTTTAVETTEATKGQNDADVVAVMAATEKFLDALHKGDLAAAKEASCEQFAALLTQSVVDRAKDMETSGDPTISGDQATVPVTYTDAGEKKSDAMPLTRQDDGQWLVCVESASSTTESSGG